MNSFALTNNSNAVPATNTAAGLRLDNNGNVRIGTSAPVATGEKLQVDGAVKVETLTATGTVADDSTPVQFASYAEMLAKSLVINAGAFSGDEYYEEYNYEDDSDYLVLLPSQRTLRLYDFPKSNFYPDSALQLTLADRNNKKRFDFNAQTGYTSLNIADDIGSNRFSLYAGKDNTFLNIADDTGLSRFSLNAGKNSNSLRFGSFLFNLGNENINFWIANRFGFDANNSNTKLYINGTNKKSLFNIIEDTNNTDLNIYGDNGYNRFNYNITKTGRFAGASSINLKDSTGRAILRFAEQNLGDGSSFSYFSLTQPLTIMTIGSTWDNLTPHLQNDFKLVLKNGSSAYYNRPGSLYAESNVIAMGTIGIGTEVFSYPETTGTVEYSLAVKGNVRAYMYKAITTGWSDFVFKKDYKLPSLALVEKHIEANGHLPNMPSEKEIVQDGINLGEMAKLQMQKIEELTLYLIEQNKQIETLTNKVKQLEKSKKQ